MINLTIEEIATKKVEAYNYYMHAQATNTANLTLEKKIALDVQNAKYAAEWLKWSGLYDEKIKEMAKT